MKRSLGIAVLVLATCLASLAQAPALSEARLVSRVSPQVATFSFQSLLMGREMTFQVVSPPKSNRPTKNKGPEPIYPILYLLHGLSGHYDNWSTKTKLAEYAATYKWVIVLPEGGDGWYTDSATVPNDRFESYIVRELIPTTSRDLRANRQSMAIAGLSMGGYGAIKFGLKYPDLFSLAGSFSGAFDAPMRTAKNGNNWPSIPAVFGPEGSKTRAENDIFALIRDLPSDRVSTLPFIYFDCGTEDPFLTINREFAALLLEKKVPHEFRELPGKHSWDYWDQQVQEFLQLANMSVKRPIS